VYGYPYGYYSYPDDSGDYDISGPAEEEPEQPGPSVSYYCQSADAYYPDVSDCPEGWQVITGGD
jgi:hypothetical protein